MPGRLLNSNKDTRFISSHPIKPAVIIIHHVLSISSTKTFCSFSRRQMFEFSPQLKRIFFLISQAPRHEPRNRVRRATYLSRRKGVESNKFVNTPLQDKGMVTSMTAALLLLGYTVPCHAFERSVPWADTWFQAKPEHKRVVLLHFTSYRTRQIESFFQSVQITLKYEKIAYFFQFLCSAKHLAGSASVSRTAILILYCIAIYYLPLF